MNNETDSFQFSYFHKCLLIAILIAELMGISGLINPLNAQEAKYFKAKKVTPADFQLESELIDETTTAIFLYNLGEARVVYEVNQRPEIKKIRKYRIKILNEGGIEQADQIIDLYRNNNGSQSFRKAKGGVYNLVNGKVEFEKLKRSDWFVEKYDKSTDLVRVSFKNVRVGSIIEFEYEIWDPFYFQPDNWEFQLDDIPVLYSEFYFTYPEVMHYSLLKFGYHPLASNPIYEENMKMPSTAVGQADASYLIKSYCFISENIPAMKREPLMDSKENYRSQIMIELKAFNVIHGSFHEYYSSWETAAREFLELDNVSKYVKPNKKWGYYYCQNTGARMDTIMEIYDFVGAEYQYSDEANFLAPSRSPKEVLYSKHATKSEINWIFLSTLIENGIEAYPILSSTRSKHMVFKEFARITQFRKMMVAIPIDDGYMLCDPSNKNLLMGEISENCMSGEGYVLKHTNPEWIPMESKFPTSQSAMIEFDTIEGGVMKGKMKLKLEGIYAYRMHNRLKNKDEVSFHELLPIPTDMEIELVTEYASQPQQPLELDFNVTYKPEKFGSSYLFPSLLYDAQNSNPLKGDKRLYPVKFPDSWKETYTCLVHLDSDKYQIVLPESASIALPNNDAQFKYSVSESLGNLVVRSKIEVNTKTYLPENYESIRKFYDLISTSQTTLIEIIEK